MLAAPGKRSFVKAADIAIEVERRGHGSPILFLGGEDDLERQSAFAEALSRDHELIIPSPPGFGASERPDWIEDPTDIAFVYLDLIDALGLEGLTLVGCSLGGWIAAEMATIDGAAIERLVLVDPFGIKVGSATERDIQDIWMLPAEEVARLKWFDPAHGERDYKAMPEEALTVIARNSESFARFCWEPYMHNPKLRHRLRRIKCPTLFVWGEEDGIVTPDYGRAYAALVPGSEFVAIPKAGHLPHIEQPAAVLDAVSRFASQPR